MKTILITGASSGIGKNLAYMFAGSSEYSTVLLAQNEENLKEIAEELSCEYIVFDLNNIKEVFQIFDQLNEKNIKLDGIVHCAGISPLMKIDENDVDTMTSTFNINVLSFIELCKGYSKYGNEGGSIVAVSSVAASVASFRQTVYGASKAALEEAVRCIAKEFLQKNTRVNCVVPGAVDTEMFKALEEKSEGLRTKMEKYYPLGMADPKYISYAIEYLLSEKAKYITGRKIDIDSGFLVAK